MIMQNLKTWWHDQTRSTHRLILSAVFLIITLGIYWFFFTPALNQHARARTNYQLALNDMAFLRQNLVSAHPQGQNREPRQDFDQNALVTTAQAVNLNLSQLQTTETDNVQIWIDEVPAQTLYTFIKALMERYNVHIARINITANTNQTVAAQINLSASAL